MIISKKTKFLTILISTLLIIFLTVKNNFLNLNNYIFEKLPIKTKVIARTIKKNNKNKQSNFKIFNNFFNDYNEKYLPETQQINLDLKIKKIHFDENFKIDKSHLEFVPKKLDKFKTHFYSFFLEQYENDVIIVDYIGNIYFFKKDRLLSKQKKLKLQKIITNLKVDKVLDVFVYKDELFISYAVGRENDCYNWNISRTALTKNKLNFVNFYSSNECTDQNFYQPNGGRIQKYTHENKNGILITIGDNTSTNKDTEEDSIVGKILFLPFDGSEIIKFSSGHRNQQGLWVENDIILSTEHGPRGGDEINRITFNSNYGWPHASYGEPYGPKSSEPKYFKDHMSNGFTEPAFVFLKAIGISEIIKLPNNFSIFWKDNFILSSLWGHSIFRLKFDKKYNKVIFSEKIYIGQRIRDIMYIKDKKLIILALEENGELGIIKAIDSN